MEFEELSTRKREIKNVEAKDAVTLLSSILKIQNLILSWICQSKAVNNQGARY